VKNVEVLRSEHRYFFEPYDAEVWREATGRAASSLGNPTITKQPRVMDSGTEAAHEVLRHEVNAAVDAQDWLEVWIITRQVRVWYDSWLVKGNAADKPWWVLQAEAEAAASSGVAEHVDLSRDAAPAMDLTSDGNAPVPVVIKRESNGKLAQDAPPTVGSPDTPPIEPPAAPPATPPEECSYEGVSWENGTWVADFIRKDGSTERLGTYDNPQAAGWAYDNALEEKGLPPVNFPLPTSQIPKASGDGIAEAVSEDGPRVTTDDAAITPALRRLEELAAKGAIDANQLDARRAQLQRQDRVANLAAVSGCYIVNEGKLVAASTTTGMFCLDLDVLQHMLSFVRSYPQCVLLATTSKQLQPLLQGKPLADRARDAPGELVWDMVVQAMKSQDHLSDAAIKQLALVAEKFPDALNQRHLPPLSLEDFPEPPLPPGRMRCRRVFTAHHGQGYLELGHRFFEQKDEEWHGRLPNKPITPLELCVSYQGIPSNETLDDLLKLGAKPTELAITIDMGNMSGGDAGVFTTTMLRAHPSLVSTTSYDLDWIEEEIEGTTCMDSEGFSKLLIIDGLVPQVGVTHAADGPFSAAYDDKAIAKLFQKAAFAKAEAARMAQAVQLCTKCNTPRARDDYEKQEWKRPGDERICRACNVRDCSRCKAPKGQSEFSKAQWDCGISRECFKCHVRQCSKCGVWNDPSHFRGEWEKADRLCLRCNKRPCSQCKKRLAPNSYSSAAWDEPDATRACKHCANKRQCGKCGVLRGPKKFSDEQWAVASDDARRCTRCENKVPHTCNSCKLNLAADAFSQTQLTKGAKARCKKCLGNA